MAASTSVCCWQDCCTTLTSDNACYKKCCNACTARKKAASLLCSAVGCVCTLVCVWSIEEVSVWFQDNAVRVVVVSSAGHQFGGLDLDDMHFRRRSYGKIKAYGQSKMCNILFAKELARRYFCNSCHVNLSLHGLFRSLEGTDVLVLEASKEKHDTHCMIAR